MQAYRGDRVAYRANTRDEKKNNKQKTHKHFSDGPCGTIVPGTNPHPSQGQTGQNGDFTVELNRKRPVFPRNGSQFVPGRDPVSQGRFLFVLDTVPPKMFMFIGFFLVRNTQEPFPSKNCTALGAVFHYCRSFSLSVSFSCRFPRKGKTSFSEHYP